jgi:hypothetical protein
VSLAEQTLSGQRWAETVKFEVAGGDSPCIPYHRSLPMRINILSRSSITDDQRRDNNNSFDPFTNGGGTHLAVKSVYVIDILFVNKGMKKRDDAESAVYGINNTAGTYY